MYLFLLFLRVNFINLLMILVLMKLTRPQFLYNIYLNFIFLHPCISVNLSLDYFCLASEDLSFLFFGSIVSIGFNTTFHFQMVFPRLCTRMT